MTVLIIAVVLIGLLFGARTLGGIIKTGCMGVLIGMIAIAVLLYFLLSHSGNW